MRYYYKIEFGSTIKLQARTKKEAIEYYNDLIGHELRKKHFPYGALKTVKKIRGTF